MPQRHPVAVVASALVIGLLCASLAHGQSRVLIAPSTGAGIVFDDNLFSSPDGLTVSDSIIRVTPGLSASRETAHSYFFGTYSFDAERYRDHAILTTPIARQNALAFARVETSPYTTWAFNGGDLYSVTPSQLNPPPRLFCGGRGGWGGGGG